MDKKYYTPSIEEFHMGFEYEYKNHDGTQRDLSKLEWNKSTVDSINDLAYIERGLNTEDNTRVKYLDKEDIESSGFKYSGKAVDDWYVLEKNLRLSSGHFFHEFKIQHDRKNSFINEEDHCYNIKIYAFGAGIEDVLFEGIIRNKSELVKLLKQLGIYDN